MNKKKLTRQEVGRLGGLAKKKQGGGWVKGVRHNSHGLPARQYHALMAGLVRAFRSPVNGIRSIRACASACGVNDRTVRRWIGGIDWPDADSTKKLQGWLLRVQDLKD